MAAHAERVNAIVSPGWFAAMDQKDLKPPPGGKGSAVEATVIFNRHTEGRTVSPWLRLVRLPTFPDTETNWLMRDIPVFLGDSEADVQALARWIKGGDTREPAAPPSGGAARAASPASTRRPATPPRRAGLIAAAVAVPLAGLLAWKFLPDRSPAGAPHSLAAAPAPGPSPTATAAPAESPQPAAPVLAAPESPRAGDLWEVPVDVTTALRFRWCPPGTFTMGRTQPEFEHLADFELTDDWERDRMSISFSHGFWMAETELTRKELAALRGTATPTATEADGMPVTGLTHAEALQLATALGARLAPTGYQARLPTEAEWEYACRAGSTGIFSFGDLLQPDLANYNTAVAMKGATPRKALEQVVAVRKYLANSWGLFDMHGNASEWCVPGESGRGAPSQPPEAGLVPARGGSFASNWIKCTSGARSYIDGSQGNPRTGMRLLLAQPTPP